MNNLLLNMGDYLSVESANLPVATFSRFQPQSADFLDITNPKAVLENGLRLFACLTTGDIIAIKYNDHIYELCVLETQPGPAVTIIECDMNVSQTRNMSYSITIAALTCVLHLGWICSAIGLQRSWNSLKEKGWGYGYWPSRINAWTIRICCIQRGRK